MGVGVYVYLCVFLSEKATFRDKFQAKPVDLGQLVFLGNVTGLPNLASLKSDSDHCKINSV